MKHFVAGILVAAVAVGCSGKNPASDAAATTYDGAISERSVADVGVMPDRLRDTADTDTERDTAIPETSPKSCENKTCEGCCRNGICHPGDQSSNCGSKSGACAACTAIAVCRAGACSGYGPDAGTTDGPITDAGTADTSDASTGDADANGIVCCGVLACYDSLCPPAMFCSPVTGYCTE